MGAAPSGRGVVSAAAPLLFALQGSRDLGEAVAAALGASLAPHEEREFEDGEHKSRPLVGVEGRDACVLHSLNGDARASAGDKLLRLLFFAGALRDAGAARVTAIAPYLAYARKDQRTKPRDPVITRYVASLFEAVGVDCVMTVDVHNLAAFENAHRRRTVNLEGAEVLVPRIAQLLEEAPAAVVSPDAGGIKRADRFRGRLEQVLGRPVASAFVEKYRSEGTLRGEALAGDVRGRVAILVDDLVSSGGTLERAARGCIAHGAARVLAAATHGLFSAGAVPALASGPIERLVITDTVDAVPQALASRVERVGVAGLIARAIAVRDAGE